MKINQYDLVELTDGRRGTVVEMYETPTLGYEVEFADAENLPIDAPTTWSFGPGEIKQVIEAFKR